MKADVIVIGSGSAGSVLAARLAMESDKRVILLEAGPSDRNPAIRVPIMTRMLANGRAATWPSWTEPEPHLNGRRIKFPHGKVIGGSSAINGLVWMRGRPSDYEKWAQAGLKGWSWRDALAAYRQIENHAGGETEEHGGSGPQPVSANDHPDILADTALEAARQAGYAVTADLNAAPYEGVGRLHVIASDGQRWSAARSFLEPARRRRNLTVLTDAHAQRIVFEGKRAVGVAAQVQGRDMIIAADEIVVCAGAVNTPKLLMLSGVGPADHLAEHGVTPVVDLPGVGQNLQDHMVAGVGYRALKPSGLHAHTRIDRAIAAFLQALILRKGPASHSPFLAGFLMRSTPDQEEPDLQAIFVPALNSDLRVMGSDDNAHGFMIGLFAMRPGSRGQVRLRSADPDAEPMIMVNYLSDPRDLATLRAGVRRVREIIAQPAFDGLRGAEANPGAAVQTDAEIDAYLARIGGTAYHPVGTARMGVSSDPMAVVDDRLRVFGVKGLRVADASVMPTITSGNTHAPTMFIGHRCADFMLGKA